MRSIAGFPHAGREMRQSSEISEIEHSLGTGKETHTSIRIFGSMSSSKNTHNMYICTSLSSGIPEKDRPLHFRKSRRNAMVHAHINFSCSMLKALRNNVLVEYSSNPILFVKEFPTCTYTMPSAIFALSSAILVASQNSARSSSICSHAVLD